MAISLYDISIKSYLQTVGAMATILEKGKAHCDAEGIDLGDIVQTRLHADMLPFSFQIHSVAHHSLGAIQGMESGEFRPPANLAELDYAGFQELMARTTEQLQGYSRDQVNGLEDRDLVFVAGERKVPFTATGFVLSFSLPNVHFHAATAYDILRLKGVPLGKRDFMGRMQIKQ